MRDLQFAINLRTKHQVEYKTMKHSPTNNSRPATRNSNRPAFTLTELLIVIAIIAVLASLATAAAINAMNKAKTTRIALEIKELERSLLTFKEDFQTFPPNAVTEDGNATSVRQVESDITRAVKKMFPRATEPAELLKKLAGDPTANNPTPVNAGGRLLTGSVGGLSGGEALVFWLSGFSEDEQYPFSGTGGPSFVPNDGPELLENRNFIGEFDLTRFGPRDSNGAFAGRYITYQDPRDNSVTRRINLWTYTPANSEQPYIYFDVSKLKPQEMFPKYGFALLSITNPADTNAPLVRPIRRTVETSTGTVTTYQQTKFANDGKFQILHAGLDDAWGEPSQWEAIAQENSPTLFPTGPFTGDIADTLTNFTQGTLEAEQE